jgi:D-cysteine desulfhydrase
LQDKALLLLVLLRAAGIETTGNKIRKLEFLLADAKSKGADCVITVGGLQSNHTRATCIAATTLGLDAYLLLRTPVGEAETDPGLVGNLLPTRLVKPYALVVSPTSPGGLNAISYTPMLL